MAWKWFSFLHVATEETLPTLNEASPAWAKDTKHLNIHDGTGWHQVLFSDDMAGMIMAFGNDTPPSGWLVCDGAEVSRTTYAFLYSKIGTKWGAGNGTTTFNVPDLCGAFLRGAGSHGSSKMANGNAFAGPAVAAFENDSVQGHKHNNPMSAYNTAGGTDPTKYAIGQGTPVAGTPAVGEPVTDGTNGTPRSSDETRPFNAGVLYCIKY